MAATPDSWSEKSKIASTARPLRPEPAHGRVVKVELGSRGYPIRIGAGLLASEAAYPELSGRRLAIVSDAQVAQHYLPGLLAALHAGPLDALVLPPGEALKTWERAGQVLDWLLSRKLGRDGCVLALGGGVIGDLAGFCAAVYQRGIDFVQVPTSLLAQVDSSVGGKTGVNHAVGKNLIGAFHQPIAVVIDTQTLSTLPRRELLAGLAEVIKYGLLADAVLFEWLEANIERLLNLEPVFLAEAIERCCAIKARIVGQDEREVAGGPRALLNLGHSFGHAIETWSGYGNWLHGEAVATGMCMALDLSLRQGWLSAAQTARGLRLIERVGLPLKPPPGMQPEDFIRLMGMDKKVQAGKLRLVLLRKLGDAMLSADFDHALLDQTLAQACGSSSAA